VSKPVFRGDRESGKYRSMNRRNDTHTTTMYHRARRYCSVSLFWAAYERCLESECARLPSAESNGEKKNERERKRKRERVRERERECVRSIIIRSNGGGGGATRRADGQIHNVSRARRRRSCRCGREGRLSCASPPRRGRDARTRVAATRSCSVVSPR